MTYSDASRPEAFIGWSGYSGASAGLVYVGGFDVGNLGVEGFPSTYNVFGGFGAKISPEMLLPAEVHSGAAWTAAQSIGL